MILPGSLGAGAAATDAKRCNRRTQYPPSTHGPVVEPFPMAKFGYMHDVYMTSVYPTVVLRFAVTGVCLWILMLASRNVEKSMGVLGF